VFWLSQLKWKIAKPNARKPLENKIKAKQSQKPPDIIERFELWTVLDPNLDSK
jgi:hypothetical protein